MPRNPGNIRGRRWLSQPWSITQDGLEVATVTRKLYSFTPVWNVATNEEHFILRGKLWSQRRRICSSA